MDPILYWLLYTTKPAHTSFVTLITKNIIDQIILYETLSLKTIFTLQDAINALEQLQFIASKVPWEWYGDTLPSEKDGIVGWEDNRGDIEIILNGWHDLMGNFTLKGWIDNPSDYDKEDNYPWHFWELQNFTYNLPDLTNSGNNEYLDGQLINQGHKSFGGLKGQRLVRDGLVTLIFKAPDGTELGRKSYMSVFYDRRKFLKWTVEIWDMCLPPKEAKYDDFGKFYDPDWALATEDGDPESEPVGEVGSVGSWDGSNLLYKNQYTGIPKGKVADFIGVVDAFVGYKKYDSNTGNLLETKVLCTKIETP